MKNIGPVNAEVYGRFRIVKYKSNHYCNIYYFAYLICFRGYYSHSYGSFIFRSSLLFLS